MAYSFRTQAILTLHKFLFSIICELTGLLWKYSGIVSPFPSPVLNSQLFS